MVSVEISFSEWKIIFIFIFLHFLGFRKTSSQPTNSKTQTHAEKLEWAEHTLWHFPRKFKQHRRKGQLVLISIIRFSLTPVFSRADEKGELLLCYGYSNKIDEVNEKARPASKGFVCRRVKQMQSLSWMVYNKPIDTILSKHPLRLMYDWCGYGR